MADNMDDLAAMIDSLGLDDIHEDSVQDLDSRDLMTEYSAIGQKLLEIGEVLDPRTEMGRTLHSRYSALKTELLRRGLI